MVQTGTPRLSWELGRQTPCRVHRPEPRRPSPRSRGGYAGGEQLFGCHPAGRRNTCAPSVCWTVRRVAG